MWNSLGIWYQKVTYWEKYCKMVATSLYNVQTNQISRASLVPDSSYIAKPAASWLDDFLVWISPEAFGCCRKFTNGSYCPPDDQVGASVVCFFSWIWSEFCSFLWFNIVFCATDVNSIFSCQLSNNISLDHWTGILFLQPPCCSSDEGPCGYGGVCKDCTTVIAYSLSMYLFSSIPSSLAFILFMGMRTYTETALL